MRKAEEAEGAQINRIVFLTRRPISEFEEEKWGFSYLRGQNFIVEVFDLTRLLFKDTATCNSVINLVERPLEGDFIHRVGSYRELDHLLGRLADNSIFVDYVMGNLDLTLKEEKIFRLLRKHRALYTFISNGALPFPALLLRNKKKKLQALRSKLLKAITHPRLLFSVLVSKVIVLLTRYQIAYPLPTVIFGGDSEILQRYVNARRIEKQTIIPVNSFDYDACILLSQGANNRLPGYENICVFLDEAATHHPDSAMIGVDPAAAEPYFAAMNRFFDFVEKETGCKIVIAAHPRSNYESMPKVFGDREVIKGKTVDLVAKSKLVIMHASTSLNYAVFFRKPIVFLKIPGMKAENQADKMVETMAFTVGNEPVDLSRDQLTPALLQCETNLEKYAEYERRYVKTSGAGDMSVWAIVAKSVRSLRIASSNLV